MRVLGNDFKMRSARSRGRSLAAWLYSASLLALLPALNACISSQATTQTQEVATVRETTRHIPGVVEGIVDTQMVDEVDMPPALDPEGVYYRPAHKTLVEVRPGRYRYLKQD
jgi:hypothetical protein